MDAIDICTRICYYCMSWIAYATMVLVGTRPCLHQPGTLTKNPFLTRLLGKSAKSSYIFRLPCHIFPLIINVLVGSLLLYFLSWYGFELMKILRTCYNCIFPFLGTDFSEAVFNEELANAATKTATELEENVSVWTKVFNFSEGLADALGFVGSLAGCVVIGFQIFRDFKEGAPVAQKALDICQVLFPSIILS